MRKILLYRFSIAAILIIALVQEHTLRTQDDFAGKPRWQTGGVIQWDVKEYYLYLPAMFIYHDPGFSFMDTMKKPESDRFWVTKTATGHYIGRFSMGMAVAYTPFFLVADGVTRLTGGLRDGFSPAYQLGLYLCGFVYSLVGFIFLGLALLRFFNDKITAITLVCIGLGTNLFYYTTTEGAMSHAVLFCLFAIFLYYTVLWHRYARLKHIIFLATALGLAVWIRPSDILAALVFLLFGVYSQQTLSQKISFFRKNGRQILAALLVMVAMAIPQLWYWHHHTGSFIYYSYTNEHFFFQHPRIFKGLFSFRKGWLLYTPMMFLALVGFFMLKKYARELFIPLLLFTVLNVYIILSWWCWWYGGGFGLRAFIESYALLAFPLAALWRWISRKNLLAFAGVAIMAAFFIRLNLFQSRQYREGMLHWDSMSKAMYQATFMKYGYVKDADKLIDPPDYDAAKKGLSEEKKQTTKGQ